MSDPTTRLTRLDAALRARPLGWGYLLGCLVTSVRTTSAAEAADVAATAVRVVGADDETHLSADIRPGRCELRLQTEHEYVSARDLALAAAITERLAADDLSTVMDAGERSIQMLEICIDALDIPSVLPFWRAVLGYRGDLESEAVADPFGTGPTVWFQQLDAPRPQRNRIHFDITVTEDEAESRIAAALAAGGRLVSDSEAKAFWILADPEGNEVCVCTWQDRD